MATSKPLQVAVKISAENATKRGMTEAAATILNTIDKQTKHTTLSAKGLEHAWTGVRSRITAAGSAMHGLGGGLAGLGGHAAGILGFGGLLSGAGIAAGLVEGTKSFIERANAIESMNKRLGISHELLGKLQYVAQKTGTDFGGLAKGFGIFEKNLYSLSHDKGGGKLGKFLAMVGPQLAKDLKGMNIDDATQKIFEVLGNTEDPIKRSALAMAAFGKGGLTIAQLAQELKEFGGFKKVADEGRELGYVISKEVVEKAHEAELSINRFKASVEGAFARNIGGSSMLGNITGVFDSLTDALKKEGSPLNASLSGLTEKLNEIDWVGMAGSLVSLTGSVASLAGFFAKYGLDKSVPTNSTSSQKTLIQAENGIVDKAGWAGLFSGGAAGGYLTKSPYGVAAGALLGYFGLRTAARKTIDYANQNQRPGYMPELGTGQSNAGDIFSQFDSAGIPEPKRLGFSRKPEPIDINLTLGMPQSLIPVSSPAPVKSGPVIFHVNFAPTGDNL